MLNFDTSLKLANIWEIIVTYIPDGHYKLIL